MGAAVLGHVHDTGSAAGPHHAGPGRGNSQGCDGRPAAPGCGSRVRLLACADGEIRADRLKVPAVVLGHHHELRGPVHGVGILRRENDGGAAGATVNAVPHRGIDDLLLPGVDLHAGQVAVVAVGVKDVGIGGVGRDEAGFPAGHREPVPGSDLTQIAAAARAHDAAVLLAPVDPIGESVVHGDFVHLRGGLVVPGAPGVAAVEADRGALIAAVHNAVGIDGVKPPLARVVAARRAFESHQGMPSVLGAVGRGAHGVDHVGVFGIHIDVAAGGVECVGAERPGCAAIVGPEQAAAPQRVETL